MRSQDKTRLAKINNLKYAEYQDIHIINGYYTDEIDNFDLGIYSSKERALEVLDEIHERIAILTTVKLIGIDDKNLKVFNECLEGKRCSVVYEMPKE